MNETSKFPLPPDFDENPEWTEEDFANAVVVRNGVEMSLRESRSRLWKASGKPPTAAM